MARARTEHGGSPRRFADLAPEALDALLDAAVAVCNSATEPVLLILKTSFGEKHPALIAGLHAAAGDRIMIIDRIFSVDETISLMDVCDCYVSLHRSE